MKDRSLAGNLLTLTVLHNAKQSGSVGHPGHWNKVTRAGACGASTVQRRLQKER